ncbi:MAG TPA: GtrA family protein [Stackebrandtia sp.]|uniref:GtrA family protein n=1 Tax=Stackebrandtia sp. TaxID=2023065 RepID=UPI002D582495|nr:GtrA family protein [Stackebrandtia sp.]HZE41883.1 GtrA family protein [Stackebrandtia sp.]
MRFLQRLPRRWRPLAEEIIKFASIGGVNTVITMVIFNVLLSIGPIKANVVATVAATTCSYFLNRHWTYRHLPKTSLRREYTLFFLFNVAGFVIESAILGVARYGMGFDEHSDVLEFNVAKVAGLVIATVFRFWAYRSFVFGGKQVAEASAARGVDSAFADILATGLDETDATEKCHRRR